MPNRILREGILTSERVNSLTWEGEVFYRRLMSVVDDYGRFSAHPSLLRAALYPLKLDAVRDANMERLLAIVEQARLVRVYEVAGKRYLEMLDFRQQVRSKESKYPQPPPLDQSAQCVADAQQVRSRCVADAHLDGDGVEDVKPLAQPDGFARFWEQYPKKRSKGDAEKAWKSIRPDRALLDRILQAIAQARLTDDWQKSGGQFIPYPATWLRAKGWEDVVASASAEQSRVLDLASIEASRRAGIEAMKARMLAETVPPARAIAGGDG